MKKALAEIDRELEERLAYFRENGKLLEAQRLEQRQGTIWKCCRKSDFVLVSRTIQE